MMWRHDMKPIINVVFMVLVVFAVLPFQGHAQLQDKILNAPFYFQDPDTETLRPTDEGDEIDWDVPVSPNTHYTEVDEAIKDDDTTRIEIVKTTTGVHDDLFEMEDTAIAEGATINSVTVYTWVRGSSLSNRPRGRVLIKTGGTEYSSETKYAGTTYVEWSNTWSTNPADSESWEVADIDALQIGINGYRGSYFDFFLGIWYYDDTYCTQVYCIVEYTLPVEAEWNPVETWWGQFVARQWVSVEWWHGQFLSRSWSSVETWCGQLMSAGWHHVEQWMGKLLTFNMSLYVIVGICVLSALPAALLLWRHYT